MYIRAPEVFRDGRSKHGVAGHVYPEINQELNSRFFLKTANGEIYLFFELSLGSFSNERMLVKKEHAPAKITAKCPVDL